MEDEVVGINNGGIGDLRSKLYDNDTFVRSRVY